MKKLIIANWKCNPEKIIEGMKILNSLKGLVDGKNKVVICPPSVFLGQFLADFGQDFTFGVQNCYFEQKGAYTGEISPKMIQSIGAKYVIIGHSERRSIFKENDDEINKKLSLILNETNLIPVLCIGENREEREAEKTYQVIARQLMNCLDNIPKEKLNKIVIAYEPVWAIGTGIYATEDKIIDARNSIVKILCDIYDKSIENKINIIYGGSVNKENIDMVINGCKMDGVLVGGASLKPKDFILICNI
ncbi:MAG: triose-phosphate isomerase [Candidatus Pacebacteria bacterium]|nr:triose-phosphate isomerase [Candidatus Paceibacterota bacterium]